MPSGSLCCVTSSSAGSGLFGGETFPEAPDRERLVRRLMPALRGLAGNVIGHFDDRPEVMRFINSAHGKALAWQGTSCPDHFVRTKVRPLYVDWNPVSNSVKSLLANIRDGFEQYRREYATYYEENKLPDSPAIRSASPSVVLVPGVGLFSFAKNKPEAEITAEFYVNAIHVMEGATALTPQPPKGGATARPPEGGGSHQPPKGGGSHRPPEGGASHQPPEGGGSHRPPKGGVSHRPPEGGATPQPPKGGATARPPEGGGRAQPAEGGVVDNYVALPPREAFNIEYWQLEEAKLRRMPAEKELSRKVAVVVGASAGIGRAIAEKLAAYGAHIVVADFESGTGSDPLLRSTRRAARNPQCRPR